VSWSGECVGCGHCCQKTFISSNGVAEIYRCQNLMSLGRIGEPDATACSVYAARTDDMPITMISLDGKSAYMSACLPSYPRTQDATPPECSYRFVPDALIQVVPRWSLTYAPRR